MRDENRRRVLREQMDMGVTAAADLRERFTDPFFKEQAKFAGWWFSDAKLFIDDTRTDRTQSEENVWLGHAHHVIDKASIKLKSLQEVAARYGVTVEAHPRQA